MSLVAWFLLLVLQNAAFTWVSRARNSGSLMYHGFAAIFSNGIFFVSNLFLIGLVTTAGLTATQLAGYLLIYIGGTVTGSVAMHYVSMRWLEAGKRKVGS
jgi:hypothetical protein